MENKREIKLLEKKLLKIILKRFRLELSSNQLDQKENIKTRFYSSKFDGASDIGYREIEGLIKFGCFEEFANKYGFALVSSKNVKGEQDLYYEIICNVSKYQESMSEIKEEETIGACVYNYS